MGQLRRAASMFKRVGGTYTDVIAMLKKLGKPTNLQGDDVFALVRKKSAVRHYFGRLYNVCNEVQIIC